jgi:hypothetical protein
LGTETDVKKMVSSINWRLVAKDVDEMDANDCKAHWLAWYKK